MKKIFYTQLHVTPTTRNVNSEVVERAFAHCWLRAESSESALALAYFHVTNYDWIIEASTTPDAVQEDQFGDLGREYFAKAARDSVSILFVGVSRDGRSDIAPRQLAMISGFDLDAFVGGLKQLANRGRCLHYESVGQCKNFIDAHSIQRSGLLQDIARNGHVLVPSADVGDLPPAFLPNETGETQLIVHC